MTTFVGLLQGINLGAKRRIAMPALRESLTDLGFSNVGTYIQSGNVVFSIDKNTEDDVALAIRERIGTDFAMDVPVILRTGEEMTRIIASNPFLPAEHDEKRLHVTFLDRAPDNDAVTRLDGITFPPDDYRVLGPEIFVRHLAGVHGSPIDFRRIARTLGVEEMTSRNWRTVTRLAEMVRDRS